MAIYIKHGSTLIEMTEQPYDAEGVLQQLLADHPDLVGEQDGDQRKRWLLVQREMGVGEEPDAGSRWSHRDRGRHSGMNLCMTTAHAGTLSHAASRSTAHNRVTALRRATLMSPARDHGTPPSHVLRTIVSVPAVCQQLQAVRRDQADSGSVSIEQVLPLGVSKWRFCSYPDDVVGDIDAHPCDVNPTRFEFTPIVYNLLVKLLQVA
jgi:hypothetical protein